MYGGRAATSTMKLSADCQQWKGDCTTSELAGKYWVHPTQVSQWKRELVDANATFAFNAALCCFRFLDIALPPNAGPWEPCYIIPQSVVRSSEPP